MCAFHRLGLADDRADNSTSKIDFVLRLFCLFEISGIVAVFGRHLMDE